MDVKLPSGVVIKGIPDGTPKEDIMRKAIAAGMATEDDFKQKVEPQNYEDQKTEQEIYLEKIAKEQGPLDATLIGIGKGMYDVARGLGLADQPDSIEKQAFENLEEERPYTTGAGEIIGQAAPFMVAGGPLGAIAHMPTRVGAATALGALEGGVITKGQGGDPLETIAGAGVGGAIAGTLEAVLPVLGRVSRKAYTRIKGKEPEGALVDANGQPTPEMREALNDAGMTWESMKKQAKDVIASQPNMASPEQTAKLAAFEQIDAPALKGEITKNLEQQKLEQGLLQSTSESAADPVRSAKLAQSEAFKGELNNIVDGLGVSGETGQAIKDALSTRFATLKADRKEAYDALAKEMDVVGDVPVSAQPILESLPDKGTLRDIASMAPGQFKALNDILVEFGIEQGEEAVESAISRGVEVTPLSLANFESLRRRLGAIESSDNTRAIGVVTGPMRKALDDEIDLATEALEKEGSQSVSQLAKEARQSNVALKSEFDDKKIVSKLINNVARWSDKPMIEASQAFQKVMAKSTPVEDVKRVVDSLNKSGAKGKQALREMQGKAVLDLIDSAFSANSRQISGVNTFGATPYLKQYEKVADKLEVLFKGSPKELKRIKHVNQLAKDIIPPNAAVPKGSAGFFIDALNKAGIYSIATKVPFASTLFELSKEMGEKGAKKKMTEKAINAKPEVRALANTINRDYPQIGAALGIAGLSTVTNEKEQDE